MSKNLYHSLIEGDKANRLKEYSKKLLNKELVSTTAGLTNAH